MSATSNTENAGLGISALKSQARRLAGKTRAQAHAQLKDTAPLMLARTGLRFLAQPAGVVSGFFPYLSEIDTRPLLGIAKEAGWQTALPVVTGDHMPLIFRTWGPGEATVSGRWNIPVPAETCAEVMPDVLLVPMLAFDAHGFRLGYGGGFYDRTLAKLRKIKPVTAVGVAYAAQKVDRVVREDHDQPLDWILTEGGPMRPDGAI